MENKETKLTSVTIAAKERSEVCSVSGIDPQEKPGESDCVVIEKGSSWKIKSVETLHAMSLQVIKYVRNFKFSRGRAIPIAPLL
jgi:hypothetical protein